MESKIIRIANLILRLNELHEELNSYDPEKESANQKVIRREIASKIKLEIKNGIITEDEGIDLATEFTSYQQTKQGIGEEE